MIYMVRARDVNGKEISFKIRSQAYEFDDVIKLAEKHCTKRNAKLVCVI